MLEHENVELGLPSILPMKDARVFCDTNVLALCAVKARLSDHA